MRKYKYLIARRITQTAILFLLFAGNAFGWRFLRGNLSSARLLDAIPLTDPFAMIQNTLAGAAISRDLLIGALIIFISYAVIGGRVFCGWVCPVNMITDAANKLRRIIGLDFQTLPGNGNRIARYCILGLSLIFSLILGVGAFEWISPIGALNREIIYGMGLGWTLVSAVFLFDLFALKNGFCGYICPLGAFYALTGRFGFLRVRHDKNKCVSCMKCIDFCPENQVLHMVGRQSGVVLSGECINCGRCIEVCGEGAIRFGNIYRQK